MTQEFDLETWYKDLEQICFDCGTSDVPLTKVDKGVSLCPHCLELLKTEYPIKEKC